MLGSDTRHLPSQVQALHAEHKELAIGCAVHTGSHKSIPVLGRCVLGKQHLYDAAQAAAAAAAAAGVEAQPDGQGAWPPADLGAESLAGLPAEAPRPAATQMAALRCSTRSLAWACPRPAQSTQLLQLLNIIH